MNEDFKKEAIEFITMLDNLAIFVPDTTLKKHSLLRGKSFLGSGTLNLKTEFEKNLVVLILAPIWIPWLTIGFTICLAIDLWTRWKRRHEK